MAIKTDVDKAKVRTAIKIYLALNGAATANQLSAFINDLDLKIRANINPTVVTNELSYCMEEGYNFLHINYYKDAKNTRRYYLENAKN